MKFDMFLDGVFYVIITDMIGVFFIPLALISWFLGGLIVWWRNRYEI